MQAVETVTNASWTRGLSAWELLWEVGLAQNIWTNQLPGLCLFPHLCNGAEEAWTSSSNPQLKTSTEKWEQQPSQDSELSAPVT